MKKSNLNVPSLLLGMALCLALVVLVGSKPPAPQVDNANAAAAQVQARALQGQKQVTLNTVMDKLELIDQRILIAEGKLNRLQEDMNRVLDDTGHIRRRVER